MNKDSTMFKVSKLLWVFILGCVAGYVLEVVFHFFRTHTYQTRQGLIYGPFAPVYGIGVLAFYLVLPKLNKTIDVFLVSSFLGGITEYLCSYFQQRWFGTISWDYTGSFMNINGRICLIFCIVWGVLGIVFIKWLYPFIEYTFDRITFKTLAQVTTVLATVFMIFNISISSLAAQRQYARRNKVMAKNDIDVFLEKYYPDEFMNRVYANKIDK